MLPDYGGGLWWMMKMTDNGSEPLGYFQKLKLRKILVGLKMGNIG